MTIKKRNFFQSKKGQIVTKDMIVGGSDGVDYYVIDTVVTKYGTPKHPYPHLIVVRNDARMSGIGERMHPEFFGLSWRAAD